MSKTKEFLYELQEFVWLIEFAGLTFEQRGKAIELMRDWGEKRFGGLGQITPDWYDAAYELIEEADGKEWATGRQAERLLSWVA